MIIAFTALNTNGEIQEFSYMPESFEAGLDVLSLITYEGNQLLSAVMIDQSGTIPLPVEAFDGQPLAEPIQYLAKEWQLILSKGVGTGVSLTQRLIDLAHQRVKRHETNIIKFRQAIGLARQRLDNFENRPSEKLRHPAMLQLLRGTLNRYEQNLSAEEKSLQVVLDQFKLI